MAIRYSVGNQFCFEERIFEDADFKVRTIHKNNLIQAKRSPGRPRHLNDLENLDFNPG